MKRLDGDERRNVISWGLYDWANSAFSTTIMAGFFPVFFKHFWSQGFSAIETTAKLATTVSVSSFLIAVASPTLGALADHRGKKKAFLIFFYVVRCNVFGAFSFYSRRRMVCGRACVWNRNDWI